VAAQNPVTKKQNGTSRAPCRLLRSSRKISLRRPRQNRLKSASEGWDRAQSFERLRLLNYEY
jgi:hypothetical protein